MSFGKAIVDKMPLARYSSGAWTAPELVPTESLSIHPAAHVLHYGSSCFEGLKAYKKPEERPRVFRIDRHLLRLQRSAELLCLPLPSLEVVEAMVRSAVENAADMIPAPPGALYIRPTLMGVEPNIGAAGHPSSEAILYVLAAPVGDYFAGGERALRILVEDQAMRSVPGFGQVKAGGNYASALRHIVAARNAHNADQVLFCPDGYVQETGASNFFLLDDHRLVTKPLDASFLHGVTRDSIIVLAKDLGYEVEEREITVRELKEWIRHGEAALSGTAAGFAGVGCLIHQDAELLVGDGRIGCNTRRLRAALSRLQAGDAEDVHRWSS
jgi:branched-chain amino acid aminotransferase